MQTNDFKVKILLYARETMRSEHISGLMNIVDRFLTDNVCVERQHNRITNADFWHEVIENGGDYQWLDGNEKWVNDSIQANPIPRTITARLKSLVYQYQGTVFGVPVTTCHMTDEEFLNSALQHDYFTKIESSGRER